VTAILKLSDTLVRVNILGVGVHVVNMGSAVDVLLRAVRQGGRGYVCVTGMHGIMESLHDTALRRIHNRSLLTVPDGMPNVWIGRMHGFHEMGRVYGPDLMMKLCEATATPTDTERPTHFFYGATPSVLEKMTTNLQQRFPGLRVVGVYAPPFRPLNEQEINQLQQQVAAARPDFFWVGLSTPKQEHFMAAFADRLETKVMLGVGAAFDLHAGLTRETAAWMKKSGLQWLDRLCQEPRRLWRRYLFNIPRFAVLAGLQLVGLRRFSMDT